jgi:LamB porin
MNFAATCALALFAFAQSAAADPVPFEFHAYARSNFQVANGLKQGSDDLNTGWGAHNRLQEGQYFELNFQAMPIEHGSFVSTLSSGSTSYPYDNSIGSLNPTGGSWLNVRNLYLQYDHVGDADGQLWFGARMFRGEDIYLFDTWPLDDHDMIGGGYARKYGESRLEFDLGVNKDSAYGVPGNSVASGGTSPTFSADTQRYLLINKFETKVGEARKLKTNLEFQYLPKGRGTVTTSTSNNGATFNIPSDYGVEAGAQVDLWAGSVGVLNYGYGNVVGNWGSSALNIVAKKVSGLVSTSGVALNEVNANAAKGAQAFTGALYGRSEFEDWGMMYALVPKYALSAGGRSGTAVSTGVRPMAYLGDHLHLGGEVDWVIFPKKLWLDNSEVAYVEVAPILEYALKRNAFGVPKFFVTPASAFYSRPVSRNGHDGRYALNTTAGMELWF